MDAWPALDDRAARNTLRALHLRAQIVGKVRLAKKRVAQPIVARDILCHRPRLDVLANPRRRAVRLPGEQLCGRRNHRALGSRSARACAGVTEGVIEA